MTVATNIYGMILIILLRIEVKMGVKGYGNLCWALLSSIKKIWFETFLGPVPAILTKRKIRGIDMNFELQKRKFAKGHFKG